MMNLFFDLDGTLTDPAVGITTCIQYALHKLGLDSPPPSEMNCYVGPPLRGTFAELLNTDCLEAVEEAVACYRERFGTVGMYENEVYPDVPGGLSCLRDAGHNLWVVTSKPEVYAREILRHFALDSFFEGIYGSELSGAMVDKAELIAHVLEREGISPDSACMIGDRAQDIAGGQANGTCTIGVLWGYGSEDELRSARPDALVGTIRELCDYIDRL